MSIIHDDIPPSDLNLENVTPSSENERKEA
jgi:hypothetical protein